MYEKLQRIAHVVKPHGKNGEVVVVVDGVLPSVMSVGRELWCVPPELHLERRHTITSVQEGPNGFLVRLSGIKNRSDAEKIQGKALLARASDVPQDANHERATSLVGMPVVDVTMGNLGIIEEALLGAAQDVWVVRSDESETMIPVVDAFVIDVADDHVVVDIPAGLIEQRGEHSREI